MFEASAARSLPEESFSITCITRPSKTKASCGLLPKNIPYQFRNIGGHLQSMSPT